MEDNREKIARVLLKIGAVSINTKNPFVYTSGIKSPIYTDCRRIISFPEERKKIVEALTEKVSQLKTEYIAAMESAGIPHASMVSQILNLPMIYIRPKKKEHGLGKRIEGYLEHGRNVLLIEDHVSTGESSLSGIESIIEEGGHIKNCLAIFTYNLNNAFGKFKDRGVSLYTLSDVYTLLNVAEKNKIINEEQKKKVYGWLEEHGSKPLDFS